MSEINSESSIKFLVSTILAGTIIGVKGGSINEYMDVTEAKINVSGNKEFFPGSSDRVVVISGSRESVLTAIHLFWELLYVFKKSSNDKSTGKLALWNPRQVIDKSVSSNDLELECKLTIPSAGAGIVLGKAGASLRSIMDQSGARVQMSNKDEGIFTQERVVTIHGTAAQGKLCTELILLKLEEDAEAATYQNRGTRYYPRPVRSAGPIVSRRREKDIGENRDRDRRPENEVADTVITMTVPENLVGNIIGKQGATVKEMTVISRAKISVSSKDDNSDGNRIVTITGTPNAAQTAFQFCNERIRQGKSKIRSDR
mmetsp:Transcript_14431/g.13034  ORF Transcript_14431/g.13034 Transcript_14431/m.13034 type:complete len:315 (+) Transcript_14431:154-1098(+)|eukprot:CAMPEP_0196762126 /NCGR_PEP_ID=MMETSP1095-20130614/1494_1 /TAXON_ID=96789 ORGANISM="Chromulina nebulosa, Strain UTEXLB2642" /NCGR_SAMPLE_ID=MMETSP1095 /ASSEMBLY_ACC=CAM_ASM_000446 /LENGTH=314 /DNA_ID=CAMNT_0042112505 /DNA_START=151 /DNA_END=1095 /DNA_ORIENTATION=-